MSGYPGYLVPVDTVQDLRSLPNSALLSTDYTFRTRGYLSVGDGGEGLYTWDPTAGALADDGILVIQWNSNPASGKFRFFNTGNDTMFRAQRCGTAISAGAPRLSFDPTGHTPWGTELERVTGLLSRAGYAGITFDPKGTYSSDSEQVAQRPEGVGFILDGQGCKLSSAPGQLPQGSGIRLYARAAGDTVTDPTNLLLNGYIADGPTTAARYWTQSFAGGAKVMTGLVNLGRVGTVPALTVAPGQPPPGVVVRIGACRTDASGWSACQYFAHVVAIDTVTNDITLDMPLPELPPFDVGINTARIQNKHDLIAIDLNGYQDNTVIKNFVLSAVAIAPLFDRNTVIDCKWIDMTFGVNAYGSVNLDLSVLSDHAHNAGSTPNTGAVVTLNACHGTHVRRNICQYLDGVNAHAEELSTEGTRIDLLDLTWDAGGFPTGSLQAISQSAFETTLISVGQLTLRGGRSQIIVNSNCHIDQLDIWSLNQVVGDGVSTAENGRIAIDLSKVERVTYCSEFESAPRSYTGKRTESFVPPYPAGMGPSETRFTCPIAGLVRRLRVFPTGDLTNIANIYIGSTVILGADDVKSVITGFNQWFNIAIAQSLITSTPNFWGLGQLIVRMESDGVASPPAGAQLALEIDLFEADPPYYSRVDPIGIIAGDTSVPMTLTGSGRPLLAANFIGQLYLDLTSDSRAYYAAVNAGTGASDWSRMTSDGNISIARRDFNAGAVSVAFSAGVYRRLRVFVDTTSGNSADPIITLGGGGINNYYSSNAYTTNPVGTSGTGTLIQPIQAAKAGWNMSQMGGASSFELTINICEIAKQSYQLSGQGNINSFPFYTVFGSGFSDAATVANSLTITFGGTTVGHIDVFGDLL